MAYAREIFQWLRHFIPFQGAYKEKDSHYTLVGNTLIRVSNHCTWMEVWDNYLQKNPKDRQKNILSLVFEDDGSTYVEESQFVASERKTPIKVTEYTFKSVLVSKQEVKMIARNLQQMANTNKFIDPTGKWEKKVRLSVNPDYMNIKITAQGQAVPAGGYGMDYPIEESEINNMEQQATKPITEAQLKQFIKECIRETINEKKEEYSPNGYRIVKGGMDYTIKGEKRHSAISVVNEFGTAYHIVEDDHCYTFFVTRKGDSHQYQYPYIFTELQEAFNLLPPLS